MNITPILPQGSADPLPPRDLHQVARNIIATEARKADLTIPNTSKAYAKLDSFLNLGTTRDLSLAVLSPQERDQFTAMLGMLLQRGVVGYEVLKVKGHPEKHYIVNEIGARRLYGKKLYHKESEAVPGRDFKET